MYRASKAAQHAKRIDISSTVSSTFAIDSVPGEGVSEPTKGGEDPLTLASNANVTVAEPEVQRSGGGGMTRSKNVQNLSLDYQTPSGASVTQESSLSVSLSNHTSSLGNWVSSTPAPVLESLGGDKQLPSTQLEPVLESDSDANMEEHYVDVTPNPALAPVAEVDSPHAEPPKKTKKKPHSKLNVDLIDQRDGNVHVYSEEYSMEDENNGNNNDNESEEEEEEEDEPLVINGDTIPAVVTPAEVDNGVRPPITQSYRPNLHLDMANMAESIVGPSLVGSVAVHKMGASMAASMVMPECNRTYKSFWTEQNRNNSISTVE